MPKQKIKKIEEEIKKEIFFNIPNMITLLRLFLIFVFIYMLFNDFSSISLVVVFAIAAASDWFDGFFARKLGQTTAMGARLDQVIDRVFTISILISLIVFMILNSTIQDWLPLLILISSRELIGLPGFIILMIRGKDAYKVRYIGKVTTFLQGFALGAIILGANWAIYLAVPTCIVGIFAGLDYLKYSVS